MRAIKLFVSLIVLLSILPTVACGSLQSLFATPTPTATNVPTSTYTPQPTSTPTDTPTPLFTPTEIPTQTPTPTITATTSLDYAEAGLTLDDFPPGFVEIPPDELVDALGLIGEQQGLPSVASFMFIHAGEGEIVIGFVNLITSTLSQVNVDLLINHPEMLMPGITTVLGENTTISEQEPLTDLEDVGEAAGGMTMVIDMESIMYRVDLVVFRRGNMAAGLVLIYPDGIVPPAVIHDLAIRFDQRIIAFQEAHP